MPLGPLDRSSMRRELEFADTMTRNVGDIEDALDGYRLMFGHEPPQEFADRLGALKRSARESKAEGARLAELDANG